MISPAFYFDITSTDHLAWEAESTAYADFEPSWFEILMEYPFHLDAFSPVDRQALHGHMAGKRVSFHAATLTLSVLSLSDAVVDATTAILQSQLQLAKYFGSELFTFHVGEYPYFYERARGPIATNVVQQLHPILQAAGPSSCQPCVENLKNKHTWPQTSGDLDALFSAWPELGLSLDLRHAMTVNEDPIQMARSFASQLKSIQYRADCGLTRADLERLFSVLEDISFDGPFIVEDPSLNELEKSHRPMIGQARKSLKGLLDF